MGYVTPEQITQAKELDLLTYLQRFDPHELVHVSGNTYCTREHDSLKISNGKWNWFSRGIGGKTALDYLIKVQGFSFTQAVETLVGQNFSPLPHVSQAKPKEQEPKVLSLPSPSRCATHAVSYLHGRGIDYDLIDYCIQTGRLYEGQPYHNVVFVGRDLKGQPRYAALRGTMGDFKGEATGSNKRYSFSIVENTNAPSVHLFESAVDLLSYPDVPIWEKYTLTIEEAAKYFRIGEKKLRKLAEENPDANWLIMNGNRIQIKRRQFEKVIDSLDVI